MRYYYLLISSITLFALSCKKAPTIELNEVKKESVEFYLSLEKIVEQAHENAMKIDTIISPENPNNPADSAGEQHIEFLIRGTHKFGEGVNDKEETFYYKSTVKINGKEQEINDSVLVSDPKKKLKYKSLILIQQDFEYKIYGKIEDITKHWQKASKLADIESEKDKLGYEKPRLLTSIPSLRDIILNKLYYEKIYGYKDYNTHQIAVKRLEEKIIETDLLSQRDKEQILLPAFSIGRWDRWFRIIHNPNFNKVTYLTDDKKHNEVTFKVPD